MQHRRIARWGLGIVGFVLLAAVACTSLQDVVRTKEQGGGTTHVYAIDDQRAWQIVDTILKLRPPNGPVDEQRSDHYLLQTIRGSGIDTGVFLGIWVEPIEPGQTKITFVRKRKGSSESVRALTERDFYRDFDALLTLAGAVCPASGGDGGAASAPRAELAGAIDGGVEPPADAAVLPPSSDAATLLGPGAAAPLDLGQRPAPSAAPPPAAAPTPTIREVPLPPRRGAR